MKIGWRYRLCLETIMTSIVYWKLDEAAVYNYFLSRMYSEGVSLKRSRKSVLK